MNLIFCHSKKSAKIAETPKSQIVGPIPPIENIFFCKISFPSNSILHKPLEKQKPIRFLAFLHGDKQPTNRTTV